MENASSEDQKYGFVVDNLQFPTSVSGEQVDMADEDQVDHGDQSPYLDKLQDGEEWDDTGMADEFTQEESKEKRSETCLNFLTTFQSQQDESLPVELSTLSDTMSTTSKLKTQLLSEQKKLDQEQKSDSSGKSLTEQPLEDVSSILRGAVDKIRVGLRGYAEWRDADKISALQGGKHTCDNEVQLRAGDIWRGLLGAYDGVIYITQQYCFTDHSNQAQKELVYSFQFNVLNACHCATQAILPGLTTALYNMAREMDTEEIEEAVVNVQSRPWVSFFCMNSVQFQLICINLHLLQGTIDGATQRVERTNTLSQVRFKTGEATLPKLTDLVNNEQCYILTHLTTLIGRLLRIHTSQDKETPIQRIVVYTVQLQPYLGKVINAVLCPTLQLLPRFSGVQYFLEGQFEQEEPLSTVAQQFLQRYRTKCVFPDTFLSSTWTRMDQLRQLCAPHTVLIKNTLSYEKWMAELTSPCHQLAALHGYWPSKKEQGDYTASLVGAVGNVEEVEVTSWKEALKGELLLFCSYASPLSLPAGDAHTQQQAQQIPVLSVCLEKIIQTHVCGSFHHIPLHCEVQLPKLLQHAQYTWYKDVDHLFEYSVAWDFQHPSLDIYVFNHLHNTMSTVITPQSQALPFLNFQAACVYSSHVQALFRHAVLYICMAGVAKIDLLHTTFEQAICNTANTSQLRHQTRKLKDTAAKGGVSALLQAGQNLMGRNPIVRLAKNTANTSNMSMKEAVRTTAIVFNTQTKLNTLITHTELVPVELSHLISFDNIALCSYISNMHYRYLQLQATHHAVQQYISKHPEQVPAQLCKMLFPALPSLDQVFPSMSIPCMEQAKMELNQWYTGVLDGVKLQKQKLRTSSLELNITPISLLKTHLQAQSQVAQHTLQDIFHMAANSATRVFLSSFILANTTLLNTCIEEGQSAYDILPLPTIPALLSQDQHILLHAFEEAWSGHPQILFTLVQQVLRDIDTLLFESQIHVQQHRTMSIAQIKEIHGFLLQIRHLQYEYVSKYRNVISIHTPDVIVSTQKESIYHYVSTNIGIYGDMVTMNAYNIDRWTIELNDESTTLYTYMSTKHTQKPLVYELPDSIMQKEMQLIMPATNWENQQTHVLQSYIPNIISFQRLVAMTREEQKYFSTHMERCSMIIETGMMEKDDVTFLANKEYLTNENKDINSVHSDTPTPSKMWYLLHHRGILFEVDKALQVLERHSWVEYEQEAEAEEQAGQDEHDEFAKLFQ